jgi:hypothetical protein
MDVFTLFLKQIKKKRHPQAALFKGKKLARS